jgi:hypothetical protein
MGEHRKAGPCTRCKHSMPGERQDVSALTARIGDPEMGRAVCDSCATELRSHPQLVGGDTLVAV